MTSWHSLLDLLQRFFQVLGVVARQLTRVAWRRLGGKPVLGHLLLREGFEKVGGSFLKLGQIMSLQIDILPKEYCDALLSLLDRVPTSSREEITGVFVAEFGRPPEELYSEFDYVAIGSASIGQVHRAKLSDGTAVAVKVRRPGVLQTFHRDFLLLQSLVWLIFLFRVRSLYFVRDLVREPAPQRSPVEMHYRILQEGKRICRRMQHQAADALWMARCQHHSHRTAVGCAHKVGTINARAGQEIRHAVGLCRETGIESGHPLGSTDTQRIDSINR